MRHPIKSLVLVIVLFTIANNASAGGFAVYYSNSGSSSYYGGPPSAAEMAVDAVIARPLGIVATVAGSAIYTVSLPFSLLGGNESDARRNLVYSPAGYTFKRPLGQF